MKRMTIGVVVFLALLWSNSTSAHERVAVIPLNSAKNLQNVVTVSPSGADFTNPAAALAAIDASPSNPYLIVIGPGVYTLSTALIMKPYVSIMGSGQDITTLTGAISSSVDGAASSVVVGASNARLTDLTIINTGGDNYSTALYNTSNSLIMENLSATASGGTQNRGIYITNSTDNKLFNVTAKAFGGETSFAIFNYLASPSMTSVLATASGGSSLTCGVYNDNSSPVLEQVQANAWGLSDNCGVFSNSSSPKIRQSTLQSNTNAICVSGGTTRVMQSSIIGGVYKTSGVLTCVTTDDGSYTLLDGLCN